MNKLVQGGDGKDRRTSWQQFVMHYVKNNSGAIFSIFFGLNQMGVPHEVNRRTRGKIIGLHFDWKLGQLKRVGGKLSTDVPNRETFDTPAMTSCKMLHF